MPTDGIRVSIIDVGKGDCILLQAGASAALIDTGYVGTSSKVVAYLRERGVKRLEYLFITHYDKDHIGGVREIGTTFPIGSFFLPAYEGADKQYRSLMGAIKDLGLPTQRVTGTLTLELGGATLTVYPSTVTFDPYAKGDEGNDNDMSLVASLVNGKDSYLFTGDLEKEGTAAYLSARRGRFDVLKMPCHGEKSLYSDDLLDVIRPQIAIITDGIDEPANKKILKMLKEAGVAYYRSSIHGTVVVTSDGAGNYSVSTDRR